MMTTDYRALCAQLADELERCRPLAEVPDCLQRARAALAESVAEGPSLEEVEDLCEEHCFNVEGYESIECLQGLINDALARWGSSQGFLDSSAAPPPAEGEVAELVAWLRMQGKAQKPGPNSLLSDRTKKEHHAAGVKLTRAADLLEQRHPAPVPVNERLPGPGDCDAEGRCWWLHVGEDGVGDWFQRRPYPSTTSYTFFRMTHWLPATALPLPQGEVE